MNAVRSVLIAVVLLDPGASAWAGHVPVACWAVPGRTHAYDGYYVGGGAVVCGQPRCANEGTWGWDYEGCLFRRRVWLQWNHGKRYQGGQGAYKTDGPPLPNLFAVPPPSSPHGADH
jgi:hypothetical protein